MLSPELKQLAELYALEMIAKEDVEWVLAFHGDNRKFDELPKEFHDYVTKYACQYDAFMATLEECL